MPDNSIENFAALVGEVDTLRTNTEASLNGLNKNFISAIDDLTEKDVSIDSGLTLCRLGDKRTLVFKDFIIPNDGLNIFKLPENDCPKNGSYFPIGITPGRSVIIGFYDDNTWRSWNVDGAINVSGRVNGTIIWYI